MLPPEARKGEFDLGISAEGIPLVLMKVRPRHFFIARKHIATAAVALAGIAAAFALIGSAADLQPQKITFTSELPTVPVPGGTYTVTATGGGSGNPVTFGIDPPSAPMCSISGSTVTFTQPGSCVIDANQAGTDKYQAAPEAQELVTVNSGTPSGGGSPGGTPSGGGSPGGSLAGQSITFTSAPQGPYFPGDTYQVVATGGGSGNQVKFSIDPAGTSVCSVTGSAVTFNQAGSCVIDANQAGDAYYQAATQAKQTVTVVNPLPQAITLTPQPAKLYSPGQRYQVTVKDSGSGNPIRLSIDASSSTWACSISDPALTSGDQTTVTIGDTSTVNPQLTIGKCVIDFNQARGGDYAAAPQVPVTLNVSVPVQVQ